MSLAWREPTSQPVDPAEKRKRFGEMAREHQSTLIRIARNFCKSDDALAQDLVQDALVNGYRAYLEGGFLDGTNAKAWLVRILTNLFLNDYRRKKKWDSPQDIEEGADLAAASSYEPDKAILEQILDGPIEVALARLPEHQRMCVTLVDIEGLDYAQVAQMMDCPIGTVRSRLARARMALYEDLVDYGRARGVIS